MLKTLLIYALGGGWGHLNRSLALARVAATKYKIKLISNSSYLSQVDTKNYEVFAISPQAGFRQTQKTIWQIIQHQSYECLIVDTFPRGLGGELQDLLANVSQPKVLVNRYLNPEYVRRYQLPEFIRQSYNLVLIPGKHEGYRTQQNPLGKIVPTSPWLIRSSPELADLATAANLLGLTIEQAQQPLIVVLASGYQKELALYGAIACSLSQQGYTVRCLSATLPPNCPPKIWRFHYPALECLWLADVVIGSGGYNTVSECAQLQLSLVAIPHQRLYDCQETRINAQQQGKCWLAKNSLMAVSLTQQLLPRAKSQPLKPRSFENGAKDASQEIERCLIDSEDN